MRRPTDTHQPSNSRNVFAGAIVLGLILIVAIGIWGSTQTNPAEDATGSEATAETTGPNSSGDASSSAITGASTDASTQALYPMDAASSSHPNTDGPASPAINCAITPCVALTFDDGPSPYTQQALSELAAANARATFFEIGQKAAATPAISKAVVDSGNELCGHSWSHSHLRNLSQAQVHDDYWKTRNTLTQATGTDIVCMRPPYGQYRPSTLAGLDGPAILWSLDTFDWRDQNTQTVIQRATSAAAGSVILMHDAYKTTVDAIPAIIQGLRARAMNIVTLDQLSGSNIQKLPAHQTYFHSAWK